VVAPTTLAQELDKQTRLRYNVHS